MSWMGGGQPHVSKRDLSQDHLLFPSILFLFLFLIYRLLPQKIFGLYSTDPEGFMGGDRRWIGLLFPSFILDRRDLTS